MENANDFMALEGAATRQCLAILNQPPAPSHQSLALEHKKARTPPSPTARWRWSTKKHAHPIPATTRWRWSTKKPAHPLSHHPWRFFFTLMPVAFVSQVMCCKASPCNALNKKLVNNLLITTRCRLRARSKDDSARGEWILALLETTGQAV